MNTLRLEKERNGDNNFVEAFSQLQEVRRSIIRDDTIDSSAHVRAEGEKGQ